MNKIIISLENKDHKCAILLNGQDVTDTAFGREVQELLVWGNVSKKERDNSEDIKDKLWFKLEFSDEKKLYNISNFSISLFPWIEEIEEISTGKGGLSLIETYIKDLLPFVNVDDNFDPLESDENLNPRLDNGLRLSSYIFLVTKTDKKLLKLIRTFSNLD